MDHHTEGSKVWVADAADGWIQAEVVKAEASQLTIRTGNGTIKVCKPEDCPLQNAISRNGLEVRAQH